MKVSIDKLHFASCMAPNAEPFFKDTVNFLASQLNIEAVLRHDIDWESRERLLDSGEIEVGWICGLPYVWKADLPSPEVELLAAPVMRAERYRDLPVYFSDVMVHAESPIYAFDDLRAGRWAYNEPRSHSGYNVVKAHLYDRGDKDGFFGSVVMAGSHENAIEMILARTVDGAAIDTTVFETTLQEDPSLEDNLRVIETLGPSPIPPWIISKSVDPGSKKRIRNALIGMHQHAEGAIVLRRHEVARYESVSDAFYDPIRSMDRKARQVNFGDEPTEG